MNDDTTTLTLKWGTLKSWRLGTSRAKEMMRRYRELGSSASAMLQRDTPEQKEIICALIDECDGDIYLEWDDVLVSKADAKKYVMEYGSQS